MTLKELLTRYASIDSASDKNSEDVPSSDGQLMLSMVLTGDLLQMGVSAQMDENGVVYVSIPETLERPDQDAIGFLCPIDTCAAYDTAQKAPVAVLAALCPMLAKKNERRRAVKLAFVPDLRIARGLAHFDRERFGAVEAYRIDNGPFGTIACSKTQDASHVVQVFRACGVKAETFLYDEIAYPTLGVGVATDEEVNASSIAAMQRAAETLLRLCKE